MAIDDGLSEEKGTMSKFDILLLKNIAVLFLSKYDPYRLRMFSERSQLSTIKNKNR